MTAKEIEEKLKELQQEKQKAAIAVKKAEALYNQILGAISILNEMK